MSANKKAIWWGCGLFAVVIIYVALGQHIGLAIPCPLHYLTGLYCPGCGVTRMLLALLQLDFYQAFRFNPLIFTLLPAMLGLFVQYFIALCRGKKPWLDEIPTAVWIILIILLIGYGVVRNLPWFSFLAPVAL